MGLKICVIHEESGTYFHDKENYLTGACFEILNIERFGGGNQIIENELLLFSKNRFCDMYQYKRTFMRGPVGALENRMRCRLSETRAFS